MHELCSWSTILWAKHGEAHAQFSWIRPDLSPGYYLVGQALVMDMKRSWSWGCSALSCVLCWCADRSSGLRQRCKKSWPARRAGSSGGDDTSTRVLMGAKD